MLLKSTPTHHFPELLIFPSQADKPSLVLQDIPFLSSKPPSVMLHPTFYPLPQAPSGVPSMHCSCPSYDTEHTGSLWLSTPAH